MKGKERKSFQNLFSLLQRGLSVLLSVCLFLEFCFTLDFFFSIRFMYNLSCVGRGIFLVYIFTNFNLFSTLKNKYRDWENFSAFMYLTTKLSRGTQEIAFNVFLFNFSRFWIGYSFFPQFLQKYHHYGFYIFYCNDGNFSNTSLYFLPHPFKKKNKIYFSKPTFTINYMPKNTCTSQISYPYYFFFDFNAIIFC